MSYCKSCRSSTQFRTSCTTSGSESGSFRTTRRSSSTIELVDVVGMAVEPSEGGMACRACSYLDVGSRDDQCVHYRDSEVVFHLACVDVRLDSVDVFRRACVVLFHLDSEALFHLACVVVRLDSEVLFHLACVDVRLDSVVLFHLACVVLFHLAWLDVFHLDELVECHLA